MSEFAYTELMIFFVLGERVVGYIDQNRASSYAYKKISLNNFRRLFDEVA